MEPDDIIPFVRQHDYQFIQKLGQGACGETVLLFDDLINEYFVCKKFSPYSEEEREDLFNRFIDEVKILHLMYNENVVRVFNFFLYPKSLTGFIMMEFVEGSDIEDYLGESPEMINEVFLQTINGFSYLEANSILHRDIRPYNLLVRDDGVLKIIDFGFGKRVHTPVDFDKSVSLNLWCDPPNEFANKVYDFTTEVYFVGKLFEHIIQANELSDFKYSNLLENMCQIEPTKRLPGFSAVMQEIQSDMFFEIGFNEDETETYRDFAKALGRHVSKIEAKTRYQDDTDKMLVELENVYRSFLLEETIPDCSVLLNTLLKGAYYYSKKNFPVRIVRDFLHLTKISSPEKRRILLSNLHTRLDAIERYTEPDTSDFDDIPF